MAITPAERGSDKRESLHARQVAAPDYNYSLRACGSVRCMKVLVIGSGGREHALAWKIRQSARVNQIFIAPGNAGTATVGRHVPVKLGDVERLLSFAQHASIALTVVGPAAV